MKAIITGASGFLGTHLVKALQKKGFEVTALDSKKANLLNPQALENYSDTKYDKLFHLAAWTQAGDFCLKHPGEQWLMNQQINTTVLNWWHRSQPQAKLVSIGTSCAYEEGNDLSEERYLLGTPIKDLYCYAMTKRMLLIGQQVLNKQFGLNYLTVIPSTLYGPDYHLGEKQMHFIFDLAWKILRYKHRGEQVVLWGDGHQRRELVFVDDFVNNLLALELDQGVKNDIVNIGAGVDHSIREFAEKICMILDVDPSVISYDTSKYVGAKNKTLSNKKIDALLPNRPVTDLYDGLKTTLKWMQEQRVFTA